MVKLLCKDWKDPLSSEVRQSAVVHPRFHDGVTEYDEEDVGWMYMPVSVYVETGTTGSAGAKAGKTLM